MLEMLLNMYRKAIVDRERVEFALYYSELTCKYYCKATADADIMKAQGRAEALLEVINTFGSEASAMAHDINHAIVARYELKYQKLENDFITEVRG